jgi:hypothetical protein
MLKSTTGEYNYYEILPIFGTPVWSSSKPKLARHPLGVLKGSVNPQLNPPSSKPSSKNPTPALPDLTS